MKSELSLNHPSDDQPTTALPSLAGWTAVIVVLCLIGVLAGAYSYGNAVRTNTQRADALAIENENHDFCSGLGLTPQSDTYSKCVLGLIEVRRHREERLNAEVAGIL